MLLDSIRQLFLPWRQDSILFEATTRCNLKCVYCYNVWKDDGNYPRDELSTERAVLLIERAIRQSKCRQFTFTGGEPTLRDDLEALVTCARALCRHVVLITNGTLLTEQKIKSLIRAGVTLFELPLNSWDSAMHDRLAGGSDCFDKVTCSAADIRYHGAELAFVFVGSRLNITHWERTLELGMALGAHNFLFNRYNAGGECHGKPELLMPSIDEVQSGLAVAEEFARIRGVGISASIAIPPCLIDLTKYPHIGFGFCAAGTRRAYYTLDPVGNVRPCNHTLTVLGNLFETSLNKLSQSEKLADFMRAKPAFCKGCKLEMKCLGGCKAAAEVCYGSLSACDPFLALNKDKATKQ